MNSVKMRFNAFLLIFVASGSSRGVDHSKNFRTPCLNYANFTQITQILRKFYAKYANFTQNTQKFTQNTQSLRNFRGVDHSKIFEPLPRNTHFLLKVRKFYAKYAKYAKFTKKRKIYRKYAKFTQNTQILHNKNEKTFLNNANFTQN